MRPFVRPLFHDRREAGVKLGGALLPYAGRDIVVLALPRGGVPVGAEVARALSAPLDVFVVRKLGVPGHEELAMGAIASGGWVVVDRATVTALRIGRLALEARLRQETAEVARRERAYRDGRQAPELRGRTVIVVDDGLATGSTMRAAVAAVKERGPAKVVVAVPVGAPDTCSSLQAIADRVVCLATPEPFRAVGLWYEDFTPTTDDEVRSILAEASPGPPASAEGRLSH
jgi:putative phosphoribosyl transferase